MPSESPRLAVDLSAGLIRVLEGSMGGPMRCGSVQLPDSVWAAGKVKDPAAAGVAVKQLAARTEITSTRALVAVSDSIATFRVLEVAAADGDQQVAATVGREMALDPERISTLWTEVAAVDGRRRIYAVAWDRAELKRATDAVRQAGLEPTAVELKSAAATRVVMDTACILIDLVTDPVEMILIDGHLPHVWHSIHIEGAATDEVAEALASPLLSVIRFHQRRRDATFGPSSPIVVSTEQEVGQHVLAELGRLVGQPVRALPAPARVATNVRPATYLTCLGLLMRRSA